MMRTVIIGLFLFAVVIFGSSIHNIDLAWNASNASECMDTNGWGFAQSRAQMYLNGLAGAQISEVMMCAAFLLLFKRDDYEKKNINGRNRR